jgi:hypothetical protein
MRTILLIVFGVALSLTTSSYVFDKKIYSGYVLLETGERIEGNIEMLSPALNQVRVKITAENGQKYLFKAQDVKEYRFTVQEEKENENCEYDYTETVFFFTKKIVEKSPVPFGSKTILLHQEVQGRVSLYNFYAETRALHQLMEHVRYVEKRKGLLQPLTLENYKLVLLEMTADFESLQERINNPNFKLEDVAELLKDYNRHIVI